MSYSIPGPGLSHFLLTSLTVLLLTVLSLPATAKEYRQNSVTITGSISSAEGNPLAGVTIQEKGTSNGTTSKEDGSFKITVTNNNAILQISFVGYKITEVPVNGKTLINITLEPLNNELGEVVVVGYGTQRKRDVTGSVASVNLETMANAPNTNIGQYLQGTVPGLNVGLSTFAGGTPPINIRGRVTLNGNQASVIIVDGIQYTSSLSSINPDDIATIDILKDASATAVYGAQGANGVILITTKKGKYNQKAKVAFSTAYTIQNPTGGNKLRPKNKDEFLEGIRQAFGTRHTWALITRNQILILNWRMW